MRWYSASTVLAAAMLPISTSCAWAAGESVPARVVGDLLWVWGNPEMSEPGQHTLASFVQASPAQRAELLGAANVVMAGKGLPADISQARALTRDVARFRSIVWEISPDGEGQGPAFTYERCLARIRELHDRFPNIEGVILDDMSTLGIDRGFKPEHIRDIRTALGGKYRAAKIWGVVYTMSFDRPRMNDYIRELDVISLWTWHARDLVNLEENVAHCERIAPDKPIILGLYLYDYGEYRQMPMELLRRQCETALSLAQAGRIEGIVFLTINDAPEALKWAANWIEQIKTQPLKRLKPAGMGTDGGPKRELRMGDGHDWRFIGGVWQEDKDGIITPAIQKADDHLAFYVKKRYSDIEVDFEFRWDEAHCGAGLVVRAQDPAHYYLVHFPCCGQCVRAEHFWAAISKADGSGWLEILKMEMVHGVASELKIWHQARVVVQGSEIRLWVDGRPFAVVRDEDFRSGYVGLESWTYETYGKPGSSFRNLKLGGEEVPARPWNESLRPPKNWFVPAPAAGRDIWQREPTLARAPNGDLLLAFCAKTIGSDRTEAVMVRSPDNGRTWRPMGTEGWPGIGYWLHTKREGKLIRIDENGLIAESKDNGNTWSQPEKMQFADFVPPKSEPEMKLSGISIKGLVEVNDGALLTFRIGSFPAARELAQRHDIWEWGTHMAAAYSTRSADGGRTWSAPVPLNGPPAVGQKYDLCECISTAQTKEGKILCLARPIYSPWMWEIWSNDGGVSWGPATSGPFPSYACTMLPHATSSGALLIGGRMPGLGLHVSHDSGMTWKHYRVGTDLWALGAMVEVQPDVVLWIYMDSWYSNLRGQFIRVTPDGLEPAREMLPAG